MQIEIFNATILPDTWSNTKSNKLMQNKEKENEKRKVNINKKRKQRNQFSTTFIRNLQVILNVLLSNEYLVF